MAACSGRTPSLHPSPKFRATHTVLAASAALSSQAVIPPSLIETRVGDQRWMKSSLSFLARHSAFLAVLSRKPFGAQDAGEKSGKPSERNLRSAGE
jgi:hypothetical protein